MIAVVGGGVAGLYCAWRLAQSKRYAQERVTLYDEGDKDGLGGRLSTVRCAETGSVFNFGAGRISRSLHPKACALVEHLGLAVTEIQCSADRWVLGARRVQLEDLLAHRVHDPHLDARLRSLAPLDWYDAALDFAASADGATISFASWMTDMIGAMPASALRDLHGYAVFTNPDLPLSEARRILRQHPETDRTDSDWIEPVDGFQSIAEALTEELLGLGVEIITGHRLVEIGDSTHRRGRTLRFETEAGRSDAVADRVVLALPPAALLGMQREFEPAVAAALRSVSPVPLFKTFITFNSRWWHDLGFADGDCIRTDLPLQRVYFRHDGSVLVYCDSDRAQYWQSVCADDAASPGALRARLTEQLAALTGTNSSDIPMASVRAKFWPCGVHFWQIGARPDAVATTLRGNPFGGLHICGEAYSPNSGWIEGSLESVEALISVLKR